MVIGADRRKSPTLLHPAYDDAAGVTARFNMRQLLTRAGFIPETSWTDDRRVTLARLPTIEMP